VNRSKQMLMRRTFVGLGIALMAVVALVASAPVESQAAGTPSDGPGDAAAWTTGNKLAVGTSADTTSKVWFTAAKGITTRLPYRCAVPRIKLARHRRRTWRQLRRSGGPIAVPALPRRLCFDTTDPAESSPTRRTGARIRPSGHSCRARFPAYTCVD
jgi:glucodextranase-like protein